MTGTPQAKRRLVEFYRGEATGTKLGAGFVRDILAAQNTIMRENQVS
jgi:hypothetical protein